jgi:hypothetical protein
MISNAATRTAQVANAATAMMKIIESIGNYPLGRGQVLAESMRIAASKHQTETLRRSPRGRHKDNSEIRTSAERAEVSC